MKQSIYQQKLMFFDTHLKQYKQKQPKYKGQKYAISGPRTDLWHPEKEVKMKVFPIVKNLKKAWLPQCLEHMGGSGNHEQLYVRS